MYLALVARVPCMELRRWLVPVHQWMLAPAPLLALDSSPTPRNCSSLPPVCASPALRQALSIDNSLVKARHRLAHAYLGAGLPHFAVLNMRVGGWAGPNRRGSAGWPAGWGGRL